MAKIMDVSSKVKDQLSYEHLYKLHNIICSSISNKVNIQTNIELRDKISTQLCEQIIVQVLQNTKVC